MTFPRIAIPLELLLEHDLLRRPVSTFRDHALADREDDVNDDRYRRGKQVRESVLGPAHAAGTAKNRTPFNADFQDFLMEYAWGAIWARPGLDRKTRSMITIAMLVGMGKLDELRLHIRATRNTGVSRDEVKELLMHAAIYCGVPAAFGAFQVAAQTFDEMDRDAAAKT
jgi:4-carboxymuconolactone decarboxylase